MVEQRPQFFMLILFIPSPNPFIIILSFSWIMYFVHKQFFFCCFDCVHQVQFILKKSTFSVSVRSRGYFKYTRFFIDLSCPDATIKIIMCMGCFIFLLCLPKKVHKIGLEYRIGVRVEVVFSWFVLNSVLFEHRQQNTSLQNVNACVLFYCLHLLIVEQSKWKRVRHFGFATGIDTSITDLVQLAR